MKNSSRSEVSESTTTPILSSPSSYNFLPETKISTLIVSHPEETSFESVSANNISPKTKISSTLQITPLVLALLITILEYAQSVSM
ncbi:9605_t:CDS:2 [Dentiscutata erythropus]|uniref:9605_t:CDS:1 n=1 Tax=Dentiscutata erythropus TaxID=1348616 RepID=A0A9N9CXM9_9GLOM|nr:9605_t:CDS:2 [Dentiscutata erythropus]